MFSSFFLGANSGGGFHSFYKELIDLSKAHAVYILKGGPGSGKSSLMRRVMKKAEENSIPVEKIYCSSDPDSLDGVVFPTLGTAIVDGTAPHVTEPSFPLAVEQYVNLGQFADIPKIQEHKKEIIEVKNKYSAYFDHVYRMCACAEKIDDELFDIALGAISVEALKKKARAIASREIVGKGSGAEAKRRFCEAISPKGYLSLLSGCEEEAKRIYIIEDSYGLSHFILSEIKSACLSAGYPCITCHSPLKPSQISHLLIPELSIAFISSSRDIPINLEYYRKIRLDSKVEAALEGSARANARNLRRIRRAFLGNACELLSSAKLVHDELEEIYNPHIDFERLYAFADEFASKLLSLGE